MKRLALPLLAIILVGFAGLGIHNVTTTKNKLELREVQLKSTTTDLKALKLKYDHLNVELDKADKSNKQQLKNLQDEKQKLEQEKQRLEAELLAKLDAKKKANQASQAALAALTGGSTAHAAGGAGNCEAWFAAAGITGSELVNARELMRRENNTCDPQRYNMAGSNACGVAQELPCGKSGCGLPPNANGACQVAWQKGYVTDRYGGYGGAIAFHNGHGWY